MLAIIRENPLLLVVAIVIGFYLFNNNVEMFQFVKPIVTTEEYNQDIRNITSYVGPYIGEIYSYLRAKYFDPAQNKTMPPMFQPAGINDPTLADPLLPIARAQIKAWIDSAKLRINQKYDKAFLAKHGVTNDIIYTETPEKVLRVVHIKNGESITYLV